jgi:hypothetical protein
MFFRKKNNTRPVTDKVASKIARAILKMQTCFANYMNKKVKNIPVSKMKTLVIIFCAVCGSYSIYLVATAVLTKDENPAKVRMQRIRTLQNVAGPSQARPIVTKEFYQRVEGFTRYMDSLKQNNVRVYDSILLKRPHLMDSVKLFEQLYKSNLK